MPQGAAERLSPPPDAVYPGIACGVFVPSGPGGTFAALLQSLQIVKIITAVPGNPLRPKYPHFLPLGCDLFYHMRAFMRVGQQQGTVFRATHGMGFSEPSLGNGPAILPIPVKNNHRRVRFPCDHIKEAVRTPTAVERCHMFHLIRPLGPVRFHAVSQASAAQDIPARPILSPSHLIRLISSPVRYMFLPIHCVYSTISTAARSRSSLPDTPGPPCKHC